MSETVFVFKAYDRVSKDAIKIELLEEKSFRSLLLLLVKRFEILQYGLGNEDEILWTFNLDDALYDITSPEIRKPFSYEEMPFEERQPYDLNYDVESGNDDCVIEITLLETKGREDDRKYPRIINLKKKA
jgi:hypothetical protein